MTTRPHPNRLTFKERHTPITLEELKEAWEHRMKALAIERGSAWASIGSPRYKEHMAPWTRAVSRIPGSGKLQWVRRLGEPVFSRNQDCIVQGVIYLEWHE